MAETPGVLIALLALLNFDTLRGTQWIVSVEYLFGRPACNRLKFSVREMSSRAFLINAFCFRRDKNDVLGTKIGHLGFSERQ